MMISTLCNSPLEVFAYFLFAYIVRQVSDPKMASLPNHYVANSSSFGNTPKHTQVAHDSTAVQRIREC